MTSTISLRSVTKQFTSRPAKELAHERTVTALDNVTLEIAAGEFVCVVGHSGSGKTTLLDLIAGLSRPTSGEVLVDGSPVQGPGPDRAVVFQQYALFPWRTAHSNIEFGLQAQGAGRRERQTRAKEYLDMVGLAGFGDRYPHELSGGMRQRVAIARGLAAEPDVLLMDEPFGALDAQTREQLQDELLRIWARTGKTIVFITHSIEEAVYLGRRVIVLASRPGRIKADLDIQLPQDADDIQDRDLRADSRFVDYRHDIWRILHESKQEAA
jgi:NitT/TauT family transport system ATP-binding protein